MPYPSQHTVHYVSIIYTSLFYTAAWVGDPGLCTRHGQAATLCQPEIPCGHMPVDGAERAVLPMAGSCTHAAAGMLMLLCSKTQACAIYMQHTVRRPTSQSMLLTASCMTCLQCSQTPKHRNAHAGITLVSKPRQPHTAGCPLNDEASIKAPT